MSEGSADAEPVQQPPQVVDAAVAGLAGQPGDHLPLGGGAALPHVDGAAPGRERLVVGGHPLGHGQRALLAQGAHELAEQVPRLVLVQPEHPGQRRGQPHALGAFHADAQQAAPLQGLPVVGGDELPHHPQAGGVLPALAGDAPLEAPGARGPPRGVADQVVDPEVVGGVEAVLQPLEDEPPLLQQRVAVLQVGREERGGLAAVAEREQFAAPAGAVGAPGVGVLGQRLVERGRHHGRRGLVAALQAAHRVEAARPAGQAAAGAAVPAAQLPHRAHGTARAAGDAGARRGAERAAADAQVVVLGGGPRDGLLQGVVIVVDGDRGVAQVQPQDLVLGAALGQEADRRVLGRRGAHQVGVAAAFAGGELERGRVAVGAVLVAGEPDVRPLPGQAGERALGGAGEQVVARGEQRVAVGVAHPAAQGDQGGQRGGGPHGAVVLSGEDPHGQVLQRLRAAVGEQGAQFPHALFGGEHPVGVAVGDAVPPGGGDELGPGVGGAADRRVVGGRQRPPRPARGVGAAGGGHQVLPVGVGRVPLERRVEEQPGRERHHRLRVVADGGAGGDALQAAAGGDPVAQAAQQHRQLGGLGPVVDVRLVQGDEAPVPGVLALEQVEVGGAQQQVLQHRVVGEQQVRRLAPHLLAADELVGQRVALAVQAVVRVAGLPVAVLGVAGVAAEGDVRAAGEQFPQPFELVVGERVHRVQQQRAHARPELAAPVLLGSSSLRMGSRKLSVLPDPVPVATTRLRPARALRMACSWCR